MQAGLTPLKVIYTETIRSNYIINTYCMKKPTFFENMNQIYLCDEGGLEAITECIECSGCMQWMHFNCIGMPINLQRDWGNSAKADFFLQNVCI